MDVGVDRMRTRIGGAVLLLGCLITVFIGCLWWLRATADVGRPLPILYVLTIVGPLMAIAGGLALRSSPGQSPRGSDSAS